MDPIDEDPRLDHTSGSGPRQTPNASTDRPINAATPADPDVRLKAPLRGTWRSRMEGEEVRLPKALASALGHQVFVTSITDGAARIYPVQVWEQIEQRLAAMPRRPPSVSRFLSWVNYFGSVQHVDEDGTTTIPDPLRTAAGLSGDVVIIGECDYLEVWNPEHLQARVAGQPFTEEDARLLDEWGIE